MSELNEKGTRFVLVHGETGCGKTWLLDEYRRQYLLQNQFLQPSPVTLYSSFANTSTHDDPLSPLWQGLSQGLDLHHDILLEFVPLARCFFPGLYQKLSQQQHLEEYLSQHQYSVTWTFDRIKLAMLQLVRRLVHANKDSLIWCLDDVHHASPESLYLLKAILLGVDGIRFVGACKTLHDDSTSSVNTAARWLMKIKQVLGPELKTRPLTNLTLKNITHLLEQQYDLKGNNHCRSLAKHIENMTAGNALAVSQLLRLLQDLRFVSRTLDELTLCKIGKLRYTPSTCIQSSVELRLRALPAPVKQLLVIASFYSSHVFNADALYWLCTNVSRPCVDSLNSSRKSENLEDLESSHVVQDRLVYASRIGFLAYYHDENLFAFDHPQIRRIVRGTLDDAEADDLHFNLGCLFHESVMTKGYVKQSSSFLLLTRGVAHWNLLSGTARLASNQVEDLAIWNHQVGKQAQQRQMWFVASKHLETALSLLDSSNEMTRLEWTCEQIQVEVNCAHWDNAAKLALDVRRQETKQQYTNIARDAQVTMYYRQPQPQKAIDSCLYWLKALGEAEFQRSPNLLDNMMKETETMLNDFIFDEWYRPSLEENAQVQDKLHVLTRLAHVSSLYSPWHYTVALLRAFQLTIQHGRFDVTPLCFVFYASLLTKWNRWNDAKRYAEMGLQLAREGLNAQFDSRTSVLFMQLAYVLGVSCRREDLMKHVGTLVLTSSLEFATMAKVTSFWSCFATTKLDLVVRDATCFLQTLSDARQDQLCRLMEPCVEIADSLLRDSGSSSDDEKKDSTSSAVPRSVYKTRMIKAFLCNDLDGARLLRDMLCEAKVESVCAEGCSSHPVQVFLYGMTLWNLAQTNTTTNMKQTVDVYKQAEVVSKQFERLVTAQVNFNRSGILKPMLLLLRAQDEACRPSSVEVSSILNSYDCGIASMQKAGCGNGLVAIGYEQAGLFLHRQGSSLAPRYLRKALAMYEHWGAHAKVEDLSKTLSLIESYENKGLHLKAAPLESCST